MRLLLSKGRRAFGPKLNQRLYSSGPGNGKSSFDLKPLMAIGGALAFGGFLSFSFLKFRESGKKDRDDVVMEDRISRVLEEKSKAKIPSISDAKHKQLEDKKEQEDKIHEKEEVKVETLSDDLTKPDDSKGSNSGEDEDSLASSKSSKISEKIRENTIRANYVLIGGGSATYAALEAIKKNEPKADILVISSEPYPPYTRPPLSKELWFSEDESKVEKLIYKDWHGQSKSIFYAKPEDFETENILEATLEDSGYKARMLVNVKAEKLYPERNIVELADGRYVIYKKLLIATGASPAIPEFAHEITDSIKSKVSVFRNIQDFRNLKANICDGASVAVVGGNFLGSELTCALAEQRKKYPQLKITQLYQESGNMDLIFPRYLSRWTSSRISKMGVDLKSNTRIKSLTEDPSNPGKVLLTTESGESHSFDHVVIATGVEPNVDLAKSGGLELDEKLGGIVVNSELSARSNIWAAGDVCSFHDVTLGRRRVEHHDHAVLSGLAAGENMSGSHKAYKHQSMFWSDLGPEIGYEAVGLLDRNLMTFSIWAKAGPKDTPKEAKPDETNLRTVSDPLHFKDSSEISVDLLTHPLALDQPAKRTQEDADHYDAMPQRKREYYGKGVVFYTRDRTIVGILLFNLFNRASLARQIISDKKTVEDIDDLVDLFNIHDHQ